VVAAQSVAVAAATLEPVYDSARRLLAVVEMEDAPMMNATRGLIGGLAVVFWAFATWVSSVVPNCGVHSPCGAWRSSSWW
jgi:hypothetical protein